MKSNIYKILRDEKCYYLIREGLVNYGVYYKIDTLIDCVCSSDFQENALFTGKVIVDDSVRKIYYDILKSTHIATFDLELELSGPSLKNKLVEYLI